MKTIKVAVFLAFVACNGANKTNNMNMLGAYKMLSQAIKTSKIDTTYTSLNQLKIFTDNYMMYAYFNPHDSSAGFGVGTYTMDKDTIIENVIYSASDSTKNDNPGSFHLNIEKTEKGYKQIIPDIPSQGDHVKLTEEYESVSTPAKSALDGAWKLTKAYTVKGKDTINSNETQYKIYGYGHFIFGRTYTDSTNKIHTATGYGSFAMSGNNKSKETVMASTYHQIRGQNIDINIEFNGTDSYNQTITGPDGTKRVEFYQKLKK